jgi:small-conductance mechanosensitive channel
MDGFSVGSLKIIPARIILAIIILTVLLAFSRWIRAQLERSWLVRTNMERGAREAVATISGYVGVAISLMIALSITGVEFGNMAIIAGALSVGIGFGLQNIVNNFVSGLILLFERPIKKGDWVVVGTTEGFVKKISIRSTQIQTFDRADIIVPNSDLISGQVTNWMLRDVKGRIRVPIGVAYGTDTSLVKKLLLDVAQQHPSVVVDSSVPEPSVLFMEFGDSALLFELRVFIKNIDQKFTVTSDLNFAIDAAFRKHNVQIPFPQRDVHIKNDIHDEPPKETD